MMQSTLCPVSSADGEMLMCKARAVTDVPAAGSSLHFDFLHSDALEGRAAPVSYALTAQVLMTSIIGCFAALCVMHCLGRCHAKVVAGLFAMFPGT